MSTPQEEKIRKIFDNAGCFAVVCDKETSEAALLAKEALAAAIKNTGVSTRFFPERPTDFSKKWGSFLSDLSENQPTFSTSILIPKNRIETKEISYTEDSRFVSININSAKEEIAKENVIFKTTPVGVDAVFFFSSNGKENIDEKLAEELSKKIILPSDNDKIITIAGSADEDEYVSEKVFNILLAMDFVDGLNIDRSPVTDLLLASLLIETDNFRRGFSERALNLASSLIKLGADQKIINNILNNNNPSFVRLLGRAMARSYQSESPKTVWTFVAEQDLEKTGLESSAPIFQKIIARIGEFFGDYHIFVLIWRDKENNDVWGLVSANQPRGGATEKLKTILPVKQNGKDIIIGPYKNFSEAELKIRNALKDIS